MHCSGYHASGGLVDDDNRTAPQPGHPPDRRSLYCDRMAIPVIGRAANALILGLVPRFRFLRLAMILAAVFFRLPEPRFSGCAWMRFQILLVLGCLQHLEQL
jgi:hypothetical protein